MGAGADEVGGVYVDRDVEYAYERCRFRWFQMTQCVKRTRQALTRRESVKLKSRFMVMHTMRTAEDPAAPKNHDVATRPAVLMRSEGSADIITEDATAACNHT